MKVKLKPYIKDTKAFVDVGRKQFSHEASLTVDKWYEAEFIYISLDQSKPHFYRLECDDGVKRKFIPNLFVTAEEWRNQQLEKLFQINDDFQFIRIV